ncbi:unnamed protein product [Dicrocoelium dendriticum]|nr:unnamed protein product [Dicrocoelium dendriticum]
METVLWTFTVPIYPSKFGRVLKTLMCYVTAHAKKFVPDLNAFLVSIQKNTLRILTADDGYFHSNHVLVPIHPELPTILVKAQIYVRVFSPRIGLELSATVISLQPHRAICDIECPNVTVVVPLSKFDAGDLSSDIHKLDPTHYPKLNFDEDEPADTSRKPAKRKRCQEEEKSTVRDSVARLPSNCIVSTATELSDPPKSQSVLAGTDVRNSQLKPEEPLQKSHCTDSGARFNELVKLALPASANSDVSSNDYKADDSVLSRNNDLALVDCAPRGLMAD